MSSASRLKIFLVDDDPLHNELLKSHLAKTLKVELQTFQTGEEAVNAIRDKPDIVILDYFLNSKDQTAANGIQVLKTIKTQLPTCKVVMLSANDKLEIATQCLRNGAFDYIIKNETSNIRAENAIVNIDRKLFDQRQAKTAKKLVMIMVAVFIVIVSIAIFFTVFY